MNEVYLSDVAALSFVEFCSKAIKIRSDLVVYYSQSRDLFNVNTEK